jgi:uncharacterized membrane protein YqhA
MNNLLRYIASTRFLVLIPVLGLLILAATLFVLGGISLIAFMFTTISEIGAVADELIFQIVEFIHFFLIGTVLYITGMGLFQLFIQPLDLPNWLKIDDIEQLELNLVGVVVVIIGVNFLRVILEPRDLNLLNYGVGYALPIAALSYFMAVRSKALSRKKDPQQGDNDSSEPPVEGS